MDVNELLEQVDILEYIQQYCDLEEKSGEWWGLSPFKEEKTPSFSVNTETRCWYDFSSGQGGNLINFVRLKEQCGFSQAMQLIMEFAGITDEVSVAAPKRLASTSIAKRFKTNERTTSELKLQKLPSNYMERFEWDMQKLLPWKEEGISFSSMRKFGVRYDSFSDRIVYPIKDYDGNIINVSGRTLDPDFKAKQIRKYTYFKPFNSNLDVLYGFSENKESILKKREVILFEGAKSVMLADTWGVENCCAVLTSHLNYQQMLFLAKLGVRVVFAFDKEIDITQDVNIQKLKRYVTIEYIYDKRNELDEKMAPVDKGREVFEKLYSERRRLR